MEGGAVLKLLAGVGAIVGAAVACTDGANVLVSRYVHMPSFVAAAATCFPLLSATIATQFLFSAWSDGNQVIP
jgi:hypothetical protein